MYQGNKIIDSNTINVKRCCIRVSLMLLSTENMYRKCKFVQTPCVLFINVQKYSVLILASVQDSLERKFGKDGGKIPIEPSDAFKARIAVSKLYDQS